MEERPRGRFLLFLVFLSVIVAKTKGEQDQCQTENKTSAHVGSSFAQSPDLFTHSRSDLSPVRGVDPTYLLSQQLAGHTENRDGNSSLFGTTLWFSDDKFHSPDLLVGFFNAVIDLTKFDHVGEGDVFLFA